MLIKMPRTWNWLPSQITGDFWLFPAKLRNFSDENIHEPGITSDVQFDKPEPHLQSVVVEIYGNGNNDHNRGYVSIVFKFNASHIFTEYLYFSCFVAVQPFKSAAGSSRFERSFMFPYYWSLQSRSGEDNVITYTVYKYIARETLLENREDLLPDDCLTLKVAVNLHRDNPPDYFPCVEAVINSSFETEERSDGTTIVLHLHSFVAKCLYEVSSVFRALCDTPMLEEDAEFFSLPCDDVGAFRSACCIIMGAKTISFKTVDEIVRLYIFADKYDVQNVIRECIFFFENILDVKNDWGTLELFEETKDEIWQLATIYDDDILKEIIVTSRRCCERRGKLLDLNFVLEQENEEFDFYR